MFTFADEPTARLGNALEEVLDELRRLRAPAAVNPGSPGARKHPLLTTLLALPVATGMLVARAATRRRAGSRDGVTATGLDMLEVELARWFTPELAFEADRKIGKVELRRYPARIEACARVDDLALDMALDHGFALLASFVYGENRTGEVIKRMTPILATMRESVYTISFVMPPGRALEELPSPVHPGVELRKTSAQTIAALRFRGPVSEANLAAHQGMLLEQLRNAGRATRGNVAFATFPSRTPLPILLRRSELWIELG